MDNPILSTTKINVSFGGLQALKGLTLDIRQGEIHALAGPNGAGKTTLFNSISGFNRPDSGKIRFMDTEIQNLRPHRIARLGIARTFQTMGHHR